ncbi:uncharacterized protein LOC120073443 [Benincasa hispida]|uniref:uncharacterized protein LOC120073443 n=1 Tax=Benincasa hispida TaxID=102211 RepID=UPI0018FF1AE9|nr:uncharacterized protein LOC120073443 [Benincasa hispida]
MKDLGETQYVLKIQSIRDRKSKGLALSQASYIDQMLISSVVKASTIKVVLSIVVSKGWALRQLDFNNAFLNGKLTEDVYMHQPPGYVNSDFPNHVCKLNKSSKKQTAVARSSIKSDYQALAHTASEIVGLQQLLSEIQYY